MDVHNRRLLNAVLAAAGMVLMLAGIVTRKYGAVVIGLVVAAVNVRQLRSVPRT